MRPAEVVARGAGYLERHGVEAARPTAESLMAAVLGTDRTALYLRSDPLTPDEARSFGRTLCRRCAGEPTQHITGTQGFRRLVLTARAGVFVPRPETEVVVAAALEAIAGLVRPTVVDVGTGTGAIALAIADEQADAEVYAVDIAPDAVTLAREHARRFGLDVRVLEGDLLDPLPRELRGMLDLVVSNPPYLLPDSIDALPADVRADPVGALVGGPDVYPRLFAAALDWLRPGGAVVVEFGDGQGSEVRAAARAARFTDPSLIDDLAGRPRGLIARRP